MKKLTSIIIIAAIFLSSFLVSFGEQLNIAAPSYILLDSKTGQILVEHNADERHYPASTTKMMTAILALENGKLDQMMTASSAAVNDIGIDGMNIGIMAGEQIDMEHLLNALLISSANETANIIAENISPSRKEFVDLMNRKAAEIGATNTHFANPCGAHDKNHYTTARDLAVIARYGMTIPKFREIVQKSQYTMPATNKHSSWPVLGSTNKLLGTKSEYYSDIIGIKTGYTGPAGNNLASAAVDGSGTELLAVVMDVGPNTGTHAVFKFSKTLLEYGFKNFNTKKLVKSNDVIKNVSVLNAKDDSTLDLVAKDSFEYILPKTENSESITNDIQLNPEIKAPVKQGDVLGQIEYKYNGNSIGKVSLVASRSIEEKPAAVKAVQGTFSNRIMLYFLLGVCLVMAAFAALRFTRRRLSKRSISKRSRYE